ncbi:hypothetical protein E6O75_ATG10138 [Venturia nashicola]|uniref:Uncharacterized protein n=1 Tax=Venturia nashicola TaxID=86259 RepID=A0A4Z1NCA6_9PEZI|nr:hypothetical protein E6O75_ATG10138 [Venturia nashicola]
MGRDFRSLLPRNPHKCLKKYAFTFSFKSVRVSHQLAQAHTDLKTVKKARDAVLGPRQRRTPPRAWKRRMQ